MISKNANVEQKEEFVRVIEDTLKDIVKNGIDKKALRAGINYHEFRFREADFGNYPRGLMYGLQLFDSWLYDETKPFIHMQAIPTFEFLKEQVETGYFEELIQKYLLDNTHGSIVIIKPERGRTARMDKELADKLQAYKDSLSKEEIDALVQSIRKSWKNIRKKSRHRKIWRRFLYSDAKIFPEKSHRFIIKSLRSSGVKLVHHEVETNGIGYTALLFDLSRYSGRETSIYQHSAECAWNY